MVASFARPVRGPRPFTLKDVELWERAGLIKGPYCKARQAARRRSRQERSHKEAAALFKAKDPTKLIAVQRR